MTTTISAMMEHLNENMKNSFPLRSVWVPKHKEYYRIGDMIRLEEDGDFDHSLVFATHKITNLKGTIGDNKFEIHLKDLDTGEDKIIHL